MAKHLIKLDFTTFVLDAQLFDTAIAGRFAGHLPYRVELVQWGNELYGSIGRDLGAENPVEDIPPGGIAYTNRGNYVCIFFGQKPAWAVEHIGDINGDSWRQLLDAPSPNSVVIRSGESEK